MAVLEFTAPRSSGLLARFGTALRDALYSYNEARSHAAEFQYYNDLSDEQLRAKGLRRDEIAQHVFRHHYL